MDIFFALVILVLIIILFRKNSELKNRIDSQELTIKRLQNKLETKITDVSNINEVITNKPSKKEVTESFIPESLKNDTNYIFKNKNTEDKINLFIDRLITFIKDNFLTITGIITLVLGIGYFVKYAIDQNWISEIMRFCIGISIGLIIIFIAHKLKKNFEIFSSILIGGGISILYFSLTIGFREYHIFSQNITFSLLTIVTIFSITLALFYKKEILAVFSIIGGFCAPLMISTGESNYIFLFSYLILLNIGMLYMSFKKKWEIISFISFVFTTIYSLAWIIDIKTKEQILFFLIIYCIFNFSSLVNYFSKKEFTITNCILFSINTITATSFITASFLTTKENSALISFGFALINLGLYFWVNNTSKNKLLKNTLLGLTISLFTFAIGSGFKANIVSLCFALESSLLLFLWKKSKENIFKIFFIILFPFLFIALCVNWFYYIETISRLSIIFNKVFITSFLVSICSIFNIFLIKDFNENEKFIGLKLNHSKLFFTIISILLIYNGVLFELIYQIEPYFLYQEIISFILIYTLFFIALILYNNKLELEKVITYLLLLISFICIFLIPIIGNIMKDYSSQDNFITSHYFLYVLYLIPTGFILYFIWIKEYFKKNHVLQVIFTTLFTYVISFEIYNLFMITTFNPLKDNYIHQQDIFRLILLPIIWAIIGFTLIFIGIKKQLKILPILGLILFGLIVLKLYLIDVWEMNNIFRIISFIVLGILILLTSFMYQKLKKLMFDLIDKKN